MALLNPTPQDDLPAEQFGEDCACEFTPYPEPPGHPDFEESWHFLRRCRLCRKTWYSTHCRCEQPLRTCGCETKNSSSDAAPGAQNSRP